MIGISTSWLASKGYSIKSAAEKVFDMGFDTVELGAAHKFEPRVLDVVKYLGGNYKDRKFTVHALFPPLDYFCMVNIADPKLFDINVEIVKSMFKAGKILNAEVIGMHGGYRRGAEMGEEYFGFHRISFGKRIDESEGRKTIERIVEVAIGLAEESGIKFCIETDTGEKDNGYATKPEDFEWMMSISKSKFFGILFDVGHAHIAAKTHGFDEYNFAKKFRDRIFEMHLHDCSAHGDSHIPVGAGVINFEKYFQSIGPRVKDIPLIFEYTNRVSMEEALKSKKTVEGLISRF
jgi:sugar phosphate isomerase/epimerase